MAMSDLAAPPVRYPLRERSIIATALHRPELGRQAWDEGLRQMHFFDEEPRRAWGLIGEVLKAGETPTLSAVAERCLADTYFVAVLAKMAEDVDTYNFESNVRKVRGACESWGRLKSLEELRQKWHFDKADPETMALELSQVAECWRTLTPASGIRSFEEVQDILSFDSTPPRYLIEGFLPEQAVTFLTGIPGTYKSWLCLAMAGAVSTGRDFMGLRCEKRPVLYLDRENPLSIVHQRLGKLDIEPNENLKIWGMWCDEQPPMIGDRRLLSIAGARKPLMIFDSLIRFHQADENSATEMSPVMGHLRQLAAAGSPVLAQHHIGRAQGSTYRGSSDIHGGCDVAFAIETDKDSNLLTLNCFKNKFKAKFSMTVRPDLDNGGFFLTEAPELLEEVGEIKRVKRMIEANPGITQGELIKAAGLTEKHGRDVLASGVQVHWRMGPGPHNSRCYFQFGSVATPIPCQTAKLNSYEDEERAAILEEARPTISTSTQPVIF